MKLKLPEWIVNILPDPNGYWMLGWNEDTQHPAWKATMYMIENGKHVEKDAWDLDPNDPKFNDDVRSLSPMFDESLIFNSDDDTIHGMTREFTYSGYPHGDVPDESWESKRTGSLLLPGPDFMRLIKAEAFYNGEWQDTVTSWRTHMDDPILARMFIDSHPISWDIRTSITDANTIVYDISTHNGMSRIAYLMYTESHGKTHVACEAGPVGCHVPELDTIAYSSMDALTIQLAKNIDTYYHADGSPRKQGESTTIMIRNNGEPVWMTLDKEPVRSLACTPVNKR